MPTKIRCLLYILPLVLLAPICSTTSHACSVGAFHGKAMKDARPMTWKNGEWGKHNRNGFFKWHNVSQVNAGNWGDSCWNVLSTEGLGLGGHSLGGESGGYDVGHHGKMTMYVARYADTVGEAISMITDEIHDTKDYPWDENKIKQALPIMDRYGNARLIETVNEEYWVYDTAQRSKYNYLVVRGSGRAHKNTDHSDDLGVGSRDDHLRTLWMGAAQSGGGIDIDECMSIARDGDPHVSDYGQVSRHIQNVSNFRFGVKTGDDPKYATVLASLGQCDYSIYIPAWAALSSSDLSSYADRDDTSVTYYTRQLYLAMGPGGPDELSDDDYINGVFADVQANIADGVTDARSKWFASGDQSDFHNTIYYLHRWSTNAAYHAIKSAYHSIGGGRSCNKPPEFSSFSVTSPAGGEIRVSFKPNEALSQYTIHWGNGTTSGWTDAKGSSAAETISNTGIAAGTYHVAVLIEDIHTHRSRNVKFGWVTVGSTVREPSITKHPQGLTVSEGGTATFAVTASGSAPLSYQWQRDGSNISGATSASYTLSSTTASDDGVTFGCKVTNAAGSATSNDATLRVVEQGSGKNTTPVVDAGSDAEVPLGTSALLSGSVQDDGLPTGGMLTVRWTRVSGPDAVAFATPETEHTTATFDQVGTYLLRLSANDGKLQSSDDVTVTVPEPRSAGAAAGANGDSGGHGSAPDPRMIGGCSAAPTSPPGLVLLLIGALVAIFRPLANRDLRDRATKTRLSPH